MLRENNKVYTYTFHLHSTFLSELSVVKSKKGTISISFLLHLITDSGVEHLNNALFHFMCFLKKIEEMIL